MFVFQYYVIWKLLTAAGAPADSRFGVQVYPLDRDSPEVVRPGHFWARDIIPGNRVNRRVQGCADRRPGVSGNCGWVTAQAALRHSKGGNVGESVDSGMWSGSIGISLIGVLLGPP